MILAEIFSAFISFTVSWPEVYKHLDDCPFTWNIPERYVITIEASGQLINIKYVCWRFTYDVIRSSFRLSAFLIDIMKNITQKLKKNCGYPLVWFIFGSNFPMLDSTIVISTNVSISTIKKHRNKLKICSVKKKAQSQNFHKIKQTLEKFPQETNVELFGHYYYNYIWRQKMENTISTIKYGWQYYIMEDTLLHVGLHFSILKFFLILTFYEYKSALRSFRSGILRK